MNLEFSSVQQASLLDLLSLGVTIELLDRCSHKALTLIRQAEAEYAQASNCDTADVAALEFPIIAN